MTAPWIAVGVLVALLVAGFAAGFLLLATGRLSLDLGWGRSLHPLGPISVPIAAPRELVAEILAAPYTGRARDPAIDLLARSKGIAVAAHHTKVHFYTARTVEVIELELPHRIGFRHLTGPVPHAVEAFALADADAGTELTYSGEIGIDFFGLGRLAARHWVKPQWERIVRAHVEDVKARAEERARRQLKRPPA